MKKTKETNLLKDTTIYIISKKDEKNLKGLLSAVLGVKGVKKSDIADFWLYVDEAFASLAKKYATLNIKSLEVEVPDELGRKKKSR